MLRLKKKTEEREKKPLTELAIRSLKTKSTRYYLHDHGSAGLWLEVFPSGTMAWRYRYRLNGRAEKIALGKYPDITLKAARRRRDELAGMVAKGDSPASQKQLAKVGLASTSGTRERWRTILAIFWLESSALPGLGSGTL